MWYPFKKKKKMNAFGDKNQKASVTYGGGGICPECGKYVSNLAFHQATCPSDEDLLKHAMKKTQAILKESIPRAKAEEILQQDLISMIKARDAEKERLGAARFIRGEESHNKKYRDVC